MQKREKFTITASRFRSHAEHFPFRRKARSLPAFLTDTPIIEAKPGHINRKKKKSVIKEKRRKKTQREIAQKRPIRSISRPNYV